VYLIYSGQQQNNTEEDVVLLSTTQLTQVDGSQANEHQAEKFKSTAMNQLLSKLCPATPSDVASPESQNLDTKSAQLLFDIVYRQQY